MEGHAITRYGSQRPICIGNNDYLLIEFNDQKLKLCGELSEYIVDTIRYKSICILANDSEVTLTFQSDSSFQRKGFELTFSYSYNFTGNSFGLQCEEFFPNYLGSTITRPTLRPCMVFD